MATSKGKAMAHGNHDKGHGPHGGHHLGHHGKTGHSAGTEDHMHHDSHGMRSDHTAMDAPGGMIPG
jgi:hypothetical protein